MGETLNRKGKVELTGEMINIEIIFALTMGLKYRET